MQQKNLLVLLKLIVLKGPCWHVQINTLLYNPMKPPATTVVNCNNTCPGCNGRIKGFVMPIKLDGLSNFLADNFINNPLGIIIPSVLIQKLSNYPSVGQVVYNRSQSVKYPPNKFVNVTILQLI